MQIIMLEGLRIPKTASAVRKKKTKLIAVMKKKKREIFGKMLRIIWAV